MRARCVVLFVAALGGCSKAAPPAPDTPAPVANAEVEVEEPVTLPTRPTPAFMPRENGGCMRAYRLVQETCVHRYYEQSQPGGLEKALAAYKRGVASPMLGPVPTPATQRLPAQRSLDPGALARRSEADANSAKERRLAELDRMLEAAREKLRERDELSKAKQVQNAPKRKDAAAAAPRAGVLEQPASPGGASDPAAARLSELSQLASQLSGEELRALTAELSQSGVDTGALEQMLRAETGNEPLP